MLSTLNADGSRRWIKPKLSHGRFLTMRRVVAYALILIFTVIPYLSMNGKPLVLLDLVTRHFTIFGRTFLPTDTLLLALLLVGCFVTIFLLSALFGRVWCGWACPQTVYMEFVFRPIERLFEGAPGRVKKGWLAGKAFSKPAKMVVYAVISVYLAHTFLAYFVGVDELRQWVTRSPLNHPGPFGVMVAVTGLMLFNFGFFREQTCIIACPYGRFQSALLDRNSLIVTYDHVRGEPRGRATRAGDDVSLRVLSAGPEKRTADCVDCGMCVTTCPTGIDIRNGLQMECINCTQCIDACDTVMAKLDRPRGLIRYSSQAAITGEKVRLLRPRVVIYPAVLLVIAVAFLVVLSGKGAADVSILRGVGRPFVELPGGEIGNPVKVKIVNRMDKPGDYRVELAGAEGLRLTIDENPIHLNPGEAKTLSAMIVAQRNLLGHEMPVVSVRVTEISTPASGTALRREIGFRLMGPAQRHEREHESESDKPGREHGGGGDK
ncbi:cytochrome c oxidase accessory protein CcoG [Synechococcus sp. Cruz CV-v-12]|uniref:cytochrome c oxidase accessory protein CcoG n=1 Tax=Synechococcus sp. Cruz CV-v-12 TaxID=2823728 RepID=UPI0020CEB214|nr:cytochrome c oxidase accessory protein CcoG [Synechococcus sp. Cruz CV-v-12]MCP9874709.1 cytochrome c oxidase accessory protein CcoG [Synechococcus sp. Cruz CV-v-12]